MLSSADAPSGDEEPAPGLRKASSSDTTSGKARADPLRSGPRNPTGNRLRRGLAEFLRLPLVMTVVFIVLGVLVSLLDAKTSGGPLRRFTESVVPSSGAVNLLSAVATSLLTVTSITFSVLLVAVQQSAGSLTPVVFDQFLRRRPNQFYFGFFIGLTAFSFIVLGMAHTKPAPVYGASLTLALTTAALVVLLLLIHSTVDQMRPQAVVRSIHDLALRARERELVLLGRTREYRRTREGTPERAVRVDASGYIVAIDVDRLGRVARAAGADAEVLVEATLGEFLVFSDPLARIVGAAPEQERWDAEVQAAFRLDEIRDVDAQSGYAVDQLENIAWANGTSAIQSPFVASIAIRALGDLAGRWLIAGERDRSSLAAGVEALPVVYPDDAIRRIVSALATLVVGTAESHQPQTCAQLVRTFSDLAPRLGNDNDRAAFTDALSSCLPAVIQHAELPRLRDALERLRLALTNSGLDTRRLKEVQRLLAEADRELLPKASNQPAAAHPE